MQASKIYCSSCGAQVEENKTNCPYCGMRIDHTHKEIMTRDGSDAQLHSALTSVDMNKPKTESIRMRVVIISIIACLLACSAFILVLWHPWNPDAYATRATEPFDTSHEGYPGQIENLSGQDSAIHP